MSAFENLTVLERALVSGKTYQAFTGLKKPNYVERMKRDRHEAQDFTQMLFYLHQSDAKPLANYLDLSGRREVLDVAGGSGVMSIALAKNNPHIRARVLDIAPVRAIAAGNVRRAGLSGRIRTLPGDIHQTFPTGHDVIMFCDIGEVSTHLLRNAYKSLPPGGLIVLADRYLSDDGTKPLDRLVSHFVVSSFGLATRGDMVDALKSCGFHAVRARNVYREVWYITGTKPKIQAQIS